MSLRRAFSRQTWEKRLLDYAYLCAEEALDPDFFDECVKMLTADWSTIVGIIEYDAEGRFSAIHHGGLATDAVAAYKAHYCRMNIFADTIDRLHLENVTTNFEPYLAAAELHRSEYYNDFLRPMRVEHVLALGISGERAARTSITLYRDGAEEPFDREDIVRFDRLRPFLECALKLRGLTRDAARDGDRQSSAEKQPPEGSPRPAIPSRWKLTPREIEVALSLAEGLSYKEVAFKLGVSFHTVNDHVDSLHRKLNLTTPRIIAVLNRRT